MAYSNHKLFLYETAVEMVITDSGTYLDNKPMSTSKLKAHKGLTNEIVFSIRNRDRKLQNVVTDTITAYIIDPNTKRRVVTKILENTGANLGLVTLELTDADLQNLSPGLYKLHITKTSVSSIDSPVYSDQNNNIRFDLEITDQADEEPIATQVATSFLQVANVALGGNANIFTTSALYGNVDRNFEEGLHTMAFYTTGYTGTIMIQGSLLESVPGSDDANTDWFKIANVSISNSSIITHTNFNINANWIRALDYPISGSLDQVQLRN